MANEERQRQAAKPHRIALEERERLVVTGVEEVLSFDEERVVMKTAQGELIVTGEGLHIGRLSLDSGELDVTGRVSELCYEEPVAAGLWSRLFS